MASEEKSITFYFNILRLTNFGRIIKFAGGKKYRTLCKVHVNLKEDNMVEVTEAATNQISEYFKGREVSPIRIFLNEGG
jgi:hypothetical protein